MTKNENLIQFLLKKDQFWEKVLTALDKCNNDRVAKELARIIYDLTSKDGNQGREWCRILGVASDGLRVLIKMMEAGIGKSRQNRKNPLNVIITFNYNNI
jgi:hypothetical protein